MTVYNVEDYIEEAIDSVINQSFDFNKVQLIIVDDGSPDNSKQIALNYQYKYPNNIIVLSKENGGQASAFNYAMDYVEGKYVNFMDPDDMISKDTLTVVNDFFNENNIDVVSLPIFTFERIEGPHKLNSKFTNDNRIVNLLDDIYSIQLSVASSFIKKEALIGHFFNTILVNGYDAVLLNEILINKKMYGLVGLNKNAYYLYRKRFSNDSIIDKSKKDDKFFTQKLINCSKYLFNYSIRKEGSVLKFIQSVVLYDLQWLVGIPEFPNTFTEEDIDNFWNYFLEIIESIDEDVIINHKFLSRNRKSFFIYIKRNDFHILAHPETHKVFFKSKNYALLGLHNLPIYINNIDIEDNFINLSGNFISYSYPENINIEAIKISKDNEDVFKANLIDFGNNYRKCLSLDWQYVYNFDLNIPISDEEAKILIRVVYEENGEKVIMYNNIVFREQSQLFNLDFLIKNSKIFEFKNNTFYIFPYNFFRVIMNKLISIKKSII